MEVGKNLAGDQPIHYEIQGSGSKTILLTHGLPSSSQEWNMMTKKLVSKGYQPIALDLPGHGESFKPGEIDFYTADTFYCHFKNWINQLNIATPPVLLGHSFGGYLSLRYAIENQRNVRGLILINPFLSSDQLSGMNRFLIAFPRVAIRFLTYAPFGLVKFLLWAGSLIRRRRRIYSFLSKGELHQAAVDFKRCSPNIIYLPGTIQNITAQASELSIPTLLIWGSRDTTLSVSWYSKLASKLPNSTYKVLYAGHNPQLSNFSEVYPAVLDFLKPIFAAE